MMSEDRFRMEYNALMSLVGGSSKFLFSNDLKNLRVTIDLREEFLVVWYNIKFYNLDAFPNSCPIVTAGEMLYDCNDVSMGSASRNMHLLPQHHRETQMCLFSDWNYNYSLYMAVSKAQRWLAAYNFHLIFRKPIETWLPHTKTN